MQRNGNGQRTFSINARVHFITLPRSHIPLEELFAFVRERAGPDATYICACEEDHKEPDAVHNHFVVRYDNCVRVRDARARYLPPGHDAIQVEAGRSFAHVVKYVKKDGKFLETGPDGLDAPKVTRKTMLTTWLNASRTDAPIPIARLAEENPQFIAGFHNLTRDIQTFNLARGAAKATNKVRGIWLWGPPGVGKSFLARKLCPGAFIKAQSKWWDGYQSHEHVILEDLDLKGECLSHHIKLWADSFPADGEVKGATAPLAHRSFVVTSNFSVEQVFGGKLSPDELITCQAIERRFAVLHLPTADRDDREQMEGDFADALAEIRFV